jgi:hypothetical protein
MLNSKPEIPYLEELKQIQSLKQSYDSLKTELTEIKKQTADSTKQDSLFQITKAKSIELLEKESQVLKDLINKQEIPGQEIKSAAERTLEGVERSKLKLKEVTKPEELASILDQNEENLKALVNEWLMPKVEQMLTGTLSEGWNPTAAKLPDFYGKGAIEKLMQDGDDPKELMGQAKEQATGKVRNISDEYLKKAEGKFSKLRLDSLGEVQVMLESEKRKFKLLEPNTLKGTGLMERVGLLLWYDPLTSFGEGIFVAGGMSYGITHQLQGFVAWTVRRSFGEVKEPLREGQGPKVGMRFSKGNWGLQSALAYHQITIEYPAGYESRNFTGKQWAGELALVRTIPMGKSLRSVVMVSWDPLFSKDKSLSKSALQLKIGFELSSFKSQKIDLKSELDRLELDEKVPKEKIKGIEPPIPFSHLKK